MCIYVMSRSHCNDLATLDYSEGEGHVGLFSDKNGPLICGGNATEPSTECYAYGGTNWFRKTSMDLKESRYGAGFCQYNDQQMIISGGKINGKSKFKTYSLG